MLKDHPDNEMIWYLVSNAPATNAKGCTTTPRKIERPAIQARTDEPLPAAISGCAAF